MADLTKEEIKQAVIEGLAQSRAELSQELTELLGIDVNTPEKRIAFMQDLMWLRESRIGISLPEAERDHIFVRKFRRTLQAAIWRAGLFVVSAAIIGLLYLAGFGQQAKLLLK